MDEQCFTEPEDTWMLHPADHHRTIIHLDVDCFYAQVEMVRNPSLRDKPLGVKQKNLMVTSNYVARSRGVKKTMWIKEALDALPDLILVDGSDLTHYRQFSSEISAVAQTFTPAVERLGLDENFVDVTEIVGDYSEESDPSKMEGHVYGDKEHKEAFPGDHCGCGCQERLIAGALVAKKLRQQIFETTGITCCAGVAHNKLLAKLVSGYYKPNQQTVLFPWLVHQLMSSLNLAKSIPGIGSSTFKILEELGICTVKDLQNSSLILLHSKFDDETSKKLKDLSFGIDETPVKRSGRPQSIGLEDAFKKVNSIAEVENKYSTLLNRLLKLLKEDGRIPATLRVCVRKLDPIKKFGNRESRQAPILPSLFAAGVQNVSDDTKVSLMEQIMGLFHKMVDTSKEYHLTLVGIGFTKFTERATQQNSISRFFLKRRRSETEDQDINEEKREDSKHSESFTPNCSLSDIHTHRSKLPLEDCFSTPGHFTSEGVKSLNKTVSIKDMLSKSLNCSSERKILKTSKGNSSIGAYNGKSSTNQEISGTSRDAQSDKNDLDDSYCDTSSPQKYCAAQNPSYDNTSPDNKSTVRAPHGIDQEVFQALPPEIQDEILLTHKRKPPDIKLKSKTMTAPKKIASRGKTSSATLDNYFKQNPVIVRASREAREPVPKKITEASGTENKMVCVTEHSSSSGAIPHLERRDERANESVSGTSSSSSPTTLQPPDGIDPSVFSALPREIQLEIVEERRHSAPVTSTSHASQPPSRASPPTIMKYIKKL